MITDSAGWYDPERNSKLLYPYRRIRIVFRVLNIMLCLWCLYFVRVAWDDQIEEGPFTVASILLYAVIASVWILVCVLFLDQCKSNRQRHALLMFFVAAHWATMGYLISERLSPYLELIAHGRPIILFYSLSALSLLHVVRMTVFKFAYYPSEEW